MTTASGASGKPFKSQTATGRAHTGFWHLRPRLSMFADNNFESLSGHGIIWYYTFGYFPSMTRFDIWPQRETLCGIAQFHVFDLT
jgi:hypothetical protein